MESLYRRHRFPPEIIGHAVWLVLPLSTVAERSLSPDIHFHVSFANLSSTFDAFMDEGWQALKALRRSTPHG